MTCSIFIDSIITNYNVSSLLSSSSCQCPQTEIKWAQNLTFLFSHGLYYPIMVAMTIPVSLSPLPTPSTRRIRVNQFAIKVKQIAQ